MELCLLVPTVSVELVKQLEVQAKQGDIFRQRYTAAGGARVFLMEGGKSGVYIAPGWYC